MIFNFLTTTLLASAVNALTDKSNVALYWGQHNYGSLAATCEAESADIILLSFLYEFGGDVTALDFSGICSDTFSDGLLHCSAMAQDIKTCQNMGKTIMLSLGGSSGAYGFSDDSVAEEFAGTLWNMFGGGSSSSVERPFDDAIIDGFDFDIENNNQVGYVALVNKLREYYNTDSSKSYYISAAPQCPYPDASVGDVLEQCHVDFAFIQFYNNYCSTIGDYFNWDTWVQYAQDTSPNKDIKLYLGLPGSSNAAGSGYADASQVVTTVQSILSSDGSSYFGGIMLWDAYWSSLNTADGKSFGNQMQAILDEYVGSSSATTQTSTSSTSTIDTITSTSSTSTTDTITSTSFTSESSSTSSTSTLTSDTLTATSELSSSNDGLALATTINDYERDTTSTYYSTSTSINSTTSSTAAPTTAQITTATTTSSTLLTLTTSSSSSSSSSSTTATAAPTSTGSAKDCANLTGLAKAQCLNSNFASGFYLGSSSECTEGTYACSEDGKFALCNFGKWVTMECASGTTCYAYTVGDDVDVGCDYTNSKQNFVKRDGMMGMIKRHLHFAH